MQKHFYLLDGVQNFPHGMLAVPKDFREPNFFWDVYNQLGHFDDFSINNFYNLNRVDILPKDSTKFIVSFLQTPQHNIPALSKDALSLLRNDPKVFLVLFNVLEYNQNEQPLINYLKKENIPPLKTVVLVSNPDYHEKVIDGIIFLSINFWESFTRYHLKLMPDISYITPDERIKTINNANRKFLSLNRNVKLHRIWWFYSILKTEMLNQGHVSYHIPKLLTSEEYNEIIDSPNMLHYIPTNLHQDFKVNGRRQMYARMLDKIDNNRDVINYNNTIKPYYADSLMSFVTESDHRGNFITEKTYKAIVNMHPFFIVGNPDHHALLRVRGYHTFENLFGSEKITTFDDATAVLTRLKNTDIEDLKTIINKRIIDKLVHNYELFWNRKTSWNSITDEVLNILEKHKNE